MCSRVVDLKYRVEFYVLGCLSVDWCFPSKAISVIALIPSPLRYSLWHFKQRGRVVGLTLARIGFQRCVALHRFRAQGLIELIRPIVADCYSRLYSRNTFIVHRSDCSMVFQHLYIFARPYPFDARLQQIPKAYGRISHWPEGFNIASSPYWARTILHASNMTGLQLDWSRHLSQRIRSRMLSRFATNSGLFGWTLLAVDSSFRLLRFPQPWWSPTCG